MEKSKLIYLSMAILILTTFPVKLFLAISAKVDADKMSQVQQATDSNKASIAPQNNQGQITTPANNLSQDSNKTRIDSSKDSSSKAQDNSDKIESRSSNTQSDDEATTRSATSDSQITPAHPVSKPPVKILGVSITSGFTTQPKDQNLYVGQASTINPKCKVTFADGAVANGVGLIYFYQWYVSNDGKHWEKQGSFKLRATTTFVGTNQKVGKKYYQLGYEARRIILGITRPSISFYSNVITVNIHKDKVPTKKIHISSSDSYLYNNMKDGDSTQLTAVTDPSDTTTKLVWKLKNPVDQPDIAKIDPDTGVVTANNDGISGETLVYATATNDSTDIVPSNEIPITIGGELDDQSVDSGQSATFRLKGAENTDQFTSIDWYQLKNGKKIRLTDSGTSQLEYKKDKVDSSDDNSLFYADIHFKKQNEQDKEFILHTNKAKLKVNYDGRINYSLKNQIFDISNPEQQIGKTHAKNVFAGDKLKLGITITNDNTDIKDKQGIIKFTLPDFVEADSEKSMVDNETPIKLTSKSSGGNTVWSVPYQDLHQGPSQTYQLNFKVNSMIKDLNFKIDPELVINDSNGSTMANSFRGNYLLADFVQNQLSLQPVDFSFGRIVSPQVDKIYSVLRMGTNEEILKVNDSRRQKDRLAITLEVDPEYRFQLPVDLMFIDDHETKHDLKQGPVTLEQSLQNQNAKSIVWDYGESLGLQFNSEDSKAGQ